MDTRSSLFDLVKSAFNLAESLGYEFRVDGEDLDLHDLGGDWVGTIGTVEVDR